MIRNGVEKFVGSDAYCDLLRAKVGSRPLVDKLPEYERMLKEDDKLEMNYKTFLLGVLSLTEGGRSEPHEKLRDEDDVSEEENDAQCALFLTSLKACGKSYVLEKCDKDGEIHIIKYEGETSFDEECDPQPKRKLRSAMKQKVGDSNEGDIEKIENVTQIESSDKVNIEKVEKVKSSSNDRARDVYHFIQKNRTAVDGNFAITYGSHTEVYFENNEEHNQRKEDNNDGSYSDVEILASEEGKTNSYVMNKESLSEFRQKVMNVLRKPYDEEEYERLWLDSEIRTPKQKHKELRNQRERSCPTNRDGKSYLDYYPGFGRKIRQYENDKPKCLNLLRGLFFWLQNSVQSDSFQPWQDEECLALTPVSY